MTRTRFRIVALALVLAHVAACASDAPSDPKHSNRLDATLPQPSERVPWTSLEARDAVQDFDFIVVTDRTGEARKGVFESAMPKVNLLQPAFVMSVGDLIEGYTEDRDVLAGQWDEIEGFVARLGMPFFYLGGNHDLSNETMAHVWKERFGPSYYHFVYKDTLFIGLNSELFGMVSNQRQSLPGPDTQSAQMDWLEGVLRDNADVRWTFVFVHQPLWDSPRIHPDWLRVEEWLGQRAYTVFAGHHHKYTKHVRHDRSFLTLATTGGGSPMRGLLYGEFDHVALVSMRAEGPTIANLLLDGIHGEDIRTAEDRTTIERLASAVRQRPSRMKGGTFRGGSLDFEIHNEGEAPLEVEGRFEASRDIAPHEATVQRLVPANSVETITVDLRARRRARFEELEPAHATWTLRTPGRDGRHFEIETNSPLLPERVFACARPPGDVEVDGILGEWSGLPFSVEHPAELRHPEHHAGPGDASFRFGVRCNAEFLYLAFDVTDDSIVATPAAIAREQDGLQVTIDARPDPERSSNRASYMEAILDGSLAAVVTLSAGPEPSPAEDTVSGSFLPPPPADLRRATRRTTRGYRTEIAVPASALDAMRGAPYDVLRIEVSLNDFDADEPGHSVLWWRPSRFGETAIEGSGTFQRR